MTLPVLERMAECSIQLIGGLGNQLFEIAAAYAYCRRYGYTLKLSPNTSHGHRTTTYWDTLLTACKPYISQSPIRITTPLWREPHFHYHAIPPGAHSLFGYFQSSRYFADYANEIRSLFNVPSDTLTGVEGAMVHVRRGDYVVGANKAFHGILTPDYYRRAIAELPAGTPLFVFSDDLEWCRGLDFLKDATFVDEPDEVAALKKMSQFRYYVISNSSFSWWATWLGYPAELVIAPDRWFGSTGPQDWEDIYEPGWKRIAVS